MLQILTTCTGCGRCVAACSDRALTLETENPDGFGEKRVVVDAALCTECGNCVPVCPHDSLKILT